MSAEQLPTAPVAPRIPAVRELHGVTDTDEYAWMREHGAAAMREYLAAERGFYDTQTARLAPLAARIFAEAAGRVSQAADDSAPWPRGGYLYWTRTPAGLEEEQLLRSPSGDGAGQDGQVLLDQNEIGATTGHVDLGVREPSPDGRLLAWSADTSGAEVYIMRIRDLDTGQDLPEVIERSYYDCAWSADSQHLFYTVPDELNRPYQICRHEVGSPAGTDVLVYEEQDARFDLSLRTTRSGGLIVITAESRDTTEVRVIPADDPAAEPVLLAPRRKGTEYRVDHHAGQDETLYLVTDDGAAEFRLLRGPVAAAHPGEWAEVPCTAVAPSRSDTRLLRCDVFAERLLLTVRRAGVQLLVSTDLDGGDLREIGPATPAGWLAVQRAEDYTAGSVAISEQSLIEPPVWFELDLATGQRRELKRRDVPGYNPAAYRTMRSYATAADGAQIPVTLAWRHDTPLDGSVPCLLYGYGAYESCEDPAFDVGLPSLLDRGVVYAIAHIRGGGECGRHWWQQGRLRAKPTTFSDFIAVADWLAGDAPGSAALVDGTRIVSRGLSAGGLLQGAVYSQAPGRWRAVVAEVPFVDCVNSMLDPGIPLTINEWDEWGDPRDAGDFACMRSYAPYDNPPAGPRPDLLVTGAVHDPRVLVHEPAKWVARLRHTDTADSRILFRVELGAGAHTGPSGRFAHLHYEAEVLACILDAMDLAQ
jgi:oligopeptidase B